MTNFVDMFWIQLFVVFDSMRSHDCICTQHTFDKLLNVCFVFIDSFLTSVITNVMV